MTSSNDVTPLTSYKCLAPMVLDPIADSPLRSQYVYQEKFIMAERLHALKARTLGKIGLRVGCQKPAGLGPKTVKTKKKAPRIVPHT